MSGAKCGNSPDIAEPVIGPRFARTRWLFRATESLPSIARLSTVKNPQHDEAVSVISVLEHIHGVEDLQYDLPVFLAPFDGTAEQRLLGQKLRLINNFFGDDI